MKKTLQGLIVISLIFLLTACSKDKESVNVGNLSFRYDTNVWEHVEGSGENSPLEFIDDSGNTISINVSQESTYQHPLMMISFVESVVSSSDDFEVYLEPNEIRVNNTTWYEYGYLYNDGPETYKVYQRFYGKYYNAASISYTSPLDDFDSTFEEAETLMSDIVVIEVDNKENEDKAKEFLVGEWDLSSAGYLVFHEDGSYEWYSNRTKDENNKHYGTYGCDIENAAMSLKEGDGIYLVLFPEGLIIDGNPDGSLTSKSDYIINFEKDELGGYPMINITSFSLYSLIEQ